MSAWRFPDLVILFRELLAGFCVDWSEVTSFRDSIAACFLFDVVEDMRRFCKMAGRVAGLTRKLKIAPEQVMALRKQRAQSKLVAAIERACKTCSAFA